MTFSSAVERVLLNPLEFRGRAGRREFWWWVLFLLVSFAAVKMVDNSLAALDPALAGRTIEFYAALMLVPTLSVHVRRLHDVNRSGFWSLWHLVPVAGQMVLGAILSLRGTTGRNRYGKSPRDVMNVYAAVSGPEPRRRRHARPGTRWP